MYFSIFFRVLLTSTHMTLFKHSKISNYFLKKSNILISKALIRRIFINTYYLWSLTSAPRAFVNISIFLFKYSFWLNSNTHCFNQFIYAIIKETRCLIHNHRKLSWNGAKVWLELFLFVHSLIEWFIETSKLFVTNKLKGKLCSDSRLYISFLPFELVTSKLVK